MPLANTEHAIGAVSTLLQERLMDLTSVDVTVGRPQPAGTDDHLNIFLYEASFNPSMKIVSLYPGETPPLWLTLKYLLTAFADGTESESARAHELLGMGARAIQNLSFLPLNVASEPALSDNPEVLKLTFDEINADMIGKIMQGGEDHYRLSLGFQVRPVMIATMEPSSHALLVGVDYTVGPPAQIIGEAGIQVEVLPKMVPRLHSLHPYIFEIGSTIVLSGENLNGSNLSIRIGPATLPVNLQRPYEVHAIVDSINAAETILSAGSHPISVIQVLNNGRTRRSNLLIGQLRPVLSTAVPNGLALSGGFIVGNIDLTGTYFNLETDDIYISLFTDGAVIHVFDQVVPVGGSPELSRIEIVEDNNIPPGLYRVLLHVNGVQAKNSPVIDLTP